MATPNGMAVPTVVVLMIHSHDMLGMGYVLLDVCVPTPFSCSTDAIAITTVCISFAVTTHSSDCSVKARKKVFQNSLRNDYYVD